jgi:hypothetical protein
VIIASLLISGVLLAAMIGIAVYGAVTLPADARVPIHFGIGTYNNFASKTVGLIIWAAAGALVFGIFAAISAHAITSNHPGSSSVRLIIMPILLAVLAVAEWGAISVARRNATLSPQ